MKLNLSEKQLQAYHELQTRTAYFQLEQFTLIEVKGPDAGSYLQTQLTNDITLLQPGKGQPGALLDRKGHLQAHFVTFQIDETFWLLTQKEQSHTLYEHLESFHFIEDVEITMQNDYSFIWLSGPGSIALASELFQFKFEQQTLYSIQSHRWKEAECFLAEYSVFNQKGILFMGQNLEAIKQSLQAHSISELDSDHYHTLRIEAGVPQYQIDMDGDTLFPQTGLEKDHVSYSKGCYLGQEVVARIKTYGVIAKALIGLVFEDELPRYNCDIVLGNKKRGQLKSACFSPVLKKNIALVYLDKNYREPGKILEFESEGNTYSATVHLLPFVSLKSNQELAYERYENALDVFTEDEEAAIPLLEEAILLDPTLADAYESLGVILSRQERFKEAIKVMHQLAEIAPELPMAHTNLSMFYMKIGDIPTAEKHLGEARNLEMALAFKSQKQKADQEKMKREELARKTEMIAMFKEVLETEDPDDLIANFGLGKALFDLEKYTEAIPYLEKAIEIQKYYSVAYLLLGKALEYTDNKVQASDVYKQGIISASQKGDLMPLKEMEQRQLSLQGS